MINIVALFLLTRIIVERPLKRLSQIVESLSNGSFPEIPWKTRRDQIGTLCRAMDRFRSALLHLHQVEKRKAEDQERIKELVSTMTQTIEGLSGQSTDMAQTAHTMQELSSQTRAASANVADLADDTARLTSEVNDSSLQINTAVGEIGEGLGCRLELWRPLLGR